VPLVATTQRIGLPMMPISDTSAASFVDAVRALPWACRPSLALMAWRSSGKTANIVVMSIPSEYSFDHAGRG